MINHNPYPSMTTVIKLSKQNKPISTNQKPLQKKMPILYYFLLLMSTTISSSSPSSSSSSHCGQAKGYQKCVSLPTQGASIAWTLHRGNATLDLAFFGSFISPSGWVGWGINPARPAMSGARVLVAFPDPATAGLVLRPFVLSPSVKLQRSQLISSPIERPRLVSSSASLHSSAASGIRSGAGVRIQATIFLHSNSTSHLHIVWNRGLYVQGYSPAIHPTTPSDLASTLTLNLVSGDNNSRTTTNSLRTVHGTINALAWGILLPGGAVAARYLRHAEPSLGPTWFYVHMAIQLTGFTLGSIGFALGLHIGSGSSSGPYSLHRKLGFAAVGLGSLQTLALLFRPKTTNRFRRYWKSYHHMVGYACVVVGVVNVFQGFEAMGEGRSYAKLGYCLVLAAMLGGCVSLEVNSWVLFCRNAKEENMRREGLIAANSGGGTDKGMSGVMLLNSNIRSP